MQEAVNPIVEAIREFLSTFGLGQYAELVAVIPFLLLLYVAYLIVMRSITLSFRKVGMPSEAISGIRLMARLLFFAVGLSTILSATTVISGTALITGGAIFGTAIGLAFSRALSNIVSGFYMLAARPFRVGDYVKIGATEGIVSELTLNYTRLTLPDMNRQFVPNSKVVESEITNYRVRVDDLMYQRGITVEEEEDEKHSRGNLIKSAYAELKGLAKGTEVYRYTFDVQVNKDYPLLKALEYFNQVSDKHTANFLERPEVMYWATTNLGNIYRIAFIVRKPMEILSVGANFQAEIAEFHEVLKSK